MFQLMTENVFWWPVEVRRPDPEKAGAIVVDTFEAQFVALSADDIEAFDEQLAKAKSTSEAVKQTVDRVLSVTRNWRDVVDAGGKPVAFSEASLRAAVGVTWVRDGILSAYRMAMRGEEARRGN